MNDDQRERRGPWLGCFAVGMLLLALYVLSVGPAVVLSDRGYLGDTFRWLYLPLIWLCYLCSPLDSAVRWYVGLWEG